MIRFTLLVLVTSSLPCLAEDPLLPGLRAAVLATKHAPKPGDLTRGATPQLTIVKHQLRDWVEGRVRSLSNGGDEGELSRLLNSELRSAGLFDDGDADTKPPSDQWTYLGVLNPIQLSRAQGFLALKTGVGIECGFDESAYLYGWSDEGWRRVWQTEQNTYEEKVYRPQTIHKVLVSPYSRTNNYAVLTLGSESWCQSNWHNVYFRAFRLGPDPSARPLVEGAMWAHIDGDPTIYGSVTTDDVLIEAKQAGGLEEAAFEAIRHYRFNHDNVQRIDPLALSPRDFVYEWLTTEWREVASWSETANRPAMLDWHKKLAERTGALIAPTMHCPSTPDSWQVGVEFGGPSKSPVYFLVRWRPPYEFRMVDVRDHPWPHCKEEDRKADEFRTLFPQ